MFHKKYDNINNKPFQSQALFVNYIGLNLTENKVMNAILSEFDKICQK